MMYLYDFLFFYKAVLLFVGDILKDPLWVPELGRIGIYSVYSWNCIPMTQYNLQANNSN